MQENANAAWLEFDSTTDPAELRAGGAWNVAQAGRLDAELGRFDAALGRSADGADARLAIDASAVSSLDTVGAWLLYRTATQWREKGVEVEIRGLSEKARTIYDQVAEEGAPRPPDEPRVSALTALLREIGQGTEDFVLEGRDFLTFLGHATVAFLRTVWRPRRWRVTSLFHHLELVGLNALPIVGLISFLIGVVLAYQGATQLERFGANVFVVDLISISILRELGILLTAIIVAGRSGSAFTAELGSMKLNEEVHALETMGLDPMEVLVLPRVLALVISLPLLAFYSDIMGLLGGALLSWHTLEISPEAFLDRLRQAVALKTLLVGLVKAPVFAAVIGLVGCSRGLSVRGSAESLGRNTTASVVQAIFLVIVLDALFSVFFNIMGV